jgi:hypothetical protein
VKGLSHSNRLGLWRTYDTDKLVNEIRLYHDVGYDKAAGGEKGRRYSRYIGSADDPAVQCVTRAAPQ